MLVGENMRPYLSGTALMVIACLACSPKPPKRPTNVPADAIWAGDKKGGTFIQIQSKTPMGWMLRIYDDHTGNLKAEGEFRLMGMARAEILPDELVRYDGQAVLLSDGGKLVSVTK
jgi:hypothetical protein